MIYLYAIVNSYNYEFSNLAYQIYNKEVKMMPYIKGHFGIIAEYNNNQISIFDTDNLKVMQTIALEADVIDVALTSDCRRAVVSSFNSKTIFQIDLTRIPATIVDSAATATFLEDIQLTPNNRYALSVDGSADNQDIVSYSLRNNEFISTLETSAQAVSISPICDGLVLTAVNEANSVHKFMIDNKGILTDTDEEYQVGDSPININFSPDGQFAFTTNYSGSVSVLSTINPDNISLINTVTASSQPQSMAISKNGKYLFVLGLTNVDIFTFDAVAGSLTLLRSFAHGLEITSFYGVDQIALDPSETRLFISGQNLVSVFTTYGTPMGTVTGALGPGGIAICHCEFK